MNSREHNGRELWWAAIDDGTVPGSSAAPDRRARPSRPGDGKEPNLVASRTRPGWHRPAIDIDHPCRLVETSPGKFHLFVEVDVEEELYFQMLLGMAEAGVVEPGYVHSACNEGASLLRLRPDEKRR